MTSDEQQIRTLIEQWAAAVRAGDLERVLSDHTDDIVMFDVPPPEGGARGLGAYAETWPGFFRWLAMGALFEIVELDVTAGSDVAFAHALLRCGMRESFEVDPTRRLRLTVGLRKVDGRWQVTHEHHSFTDHTVEADGAVRAVHEGWTRATADADLDALSRA